MFSSEMGTWHSPLEGGEDAVVKGSRPEPGTRRRSVMPAIITHPLTGTEPELSTAMVEFQASVPPRFLSPHGEVISIPTPRVSGPSLQSPRK